jgi:hypothetical protein
MSDQDNSKFYEEISQGIASEHDSPVILPAAVPRKDSGTGSFTTLIPPNPPVACWQMNSICFEFDSPFVDLVAAPIFAKLESLHKNLLQKFTAIYNARPLLALFGHADPVGKEVYNKQLSEDRAKAVFGLLVRNPQIWLRIFSSKENYLRQKLKAAGITTPDLTQAINEYMIKLCGSFRLTLNDFIGGASHGYQGCSEFNPLRVFSEAEEKDYQKPGQRVKRDQENQVNRRVTGFFFKPGTSAQPASWPCPRAPDVQTCRNNFVSDGNARLTPGPDRREKDTFACGFYNRLAQNSPCEQIRETLLEISLGFEGEAPYLWSLEQREVNALGKVRVYDYEELRTLYEVAVDNLKHAKPESPSQKARWEEISSLGEEGFCNEVRSWVAAVVNVAYSTAVRGGKTIYMVDAVVKTNKTGRLLFTGHVESELRVSRRGRWYLSSPDDSKRQVWRQITTDTVVPKGARTMEIVEPVGLVDKMDELYDQLRGGRTGNITKRVESMLLGGQP